MERLIRFAGVSLVLTAGLVLGFYPTLFSGFRLMQAGAGDTRFNNYVLEHEYRWLLREGPHRSFWDPPMLFPERNTLAYSDILLTVAPPYWALRGLGLPPDAAFQAWMLVMGALNYAAGYLFLRRLFPLSPPAASLGAFLFSFGSARLSQLQHHQLLPQFFTLGAVACLIAAFRATPPLSPPGRRARLWGFFACTVAQLYAGYYLGYFLLMGILAAGLWAIASRQYRPALLGIARSHPFTLGLGALASAVALSPMMVHYMGAARVVGARWPGAAEPWLPHVQSWIYLGSGSALYGFLSKLALFRDMPMSHAQSLGLGLATTALTVAGLWAGRRRAAVRLMTLAALTLMVSVTVFPGGVKLWRVLYYALPGIQGLRAVSRIGILLLLPAGLGLGLALDALRRRGLGAAALALGGLCCLEQAQSLTFYDRQAIRDDTVRVARLIDPGCRAFLYVPYKARDPGFKHQLDAMWAGLAAGVPTVNGHSGNYPPDWPFLKIKVRSPAALDRKERELAAWLRKRGETEMGVCLISNAPGYGGYGWLRGRT